jgi:hypothetical protein
VLHDTIQALDRSFFRQVALNKTYKPRHMKTNIALKFDRSSIFSMVIAATIAFSCQINCATAKLDEDAAAKINTMLDRANSNSSKNNSTSDNDSNSSRNNNSKNKRSQSMEYLRRGLVARKAQENSQALEYFAASAKADPQNAFAYMALATTLGHSQQGLSYMKTAMLLFDRQGNKEAVRLAKQWLEQQPPSEGF